MRTGTIIASENSNLLKTYLHHKGGTYTLLAVGRFSEAREEEFAVYVSHMTQQIWIRPLPMFNEVIRWPDGVDRPRFLELKPGTPLNLQPMAPGS